MKKSINLYFTQYDEKEKIDAIKRAGYDEVFIGMYDDNTSMTWREQVKYAQKNKLALTMIHCSYYKPNLNYFWENGEKGDQVEKSYIDQIEQCGKYTKNFVIHLCESKKVKQTPIGLERLKRILKVCEKFDINLAVENLYSAQEIEYIFDNISHPLLKICFDSGHKNFLTKNFDIMKKYGDRVSVLHLNDNYGENDEHKILGYGNINLINLAKSLCPNKNITLASEIRYDENMNKVLKDNLISLNNLDELIQKDYTNNIT